MTITMFAKEPISTGSWVELTDEGTVRAISYDTSRKARFLRWIGRKFHWQRLIYYGFDAAHFLGIAVMDSVYDDAVKCDRVLIGISPTQY